MTLIKFETIPVKENHEPLVDLSQYDFVIDPQYYKNGLSKDQRIFLRKGMVEKLLEIQEKLKDYKFKIWDGYRSREVQNNIYQDFKAKLRKDNPKWDAAKLNREVGKFVTSADDHSRIPPHATGGAVDLTLVDLEGNEVDMGTGFDFFGEESQSLYFERNNNDGKVRNNRRTLRNVMVEAGFRSDDDEWWHFDYGNQIWAKHYGKPKAMYGEKTNIKGV